MTRHETTAQVARRCKPSFNSYSGEFGRSNGVLGHVQVQFLQAMFIVIAGEILGEMRVRIHETRTKRRITKIYEACAIGNHQMASCVYNLVVLHKDYAVLH